MGSGLMLGQGRAMAVGAITRFKFGNQFSAPRTAQSREGRRETVVLVSFEK